MDPTHASLVSAWLQKPNGDQVPIKGTCSIGRAPTNEVVLPDEKVSRRHAFVQAQEAHEFWLVDLGSINGSYLNGRRVTQPIRLRDQDQIDIGATRLAFRQPTTIQVSAPRGDAAEQTIQDIKSAPCWLLVADIAASTQLGKMLSGDELPVITGRWLAECKEIIEACGGSINKFLGDGFLAYWHHRDATAVGVTRALAALARLQAQAQPRFRVVLHFGPVLVGGVVSMGEESLLGREVNFVFRMEKVAASLATPTLISEAARTQLATQLEADPSGPHPVPSFEGEFLFYTPRF